MLGCKTHYGYVVFAGACLLMLPQSLPINTASIFYAPVTADLGISISDFSIHTTVISLSIFLMTSYVTRLFHACDIRTFMTAIVVMEALCFFAYALASSVWVFYISSFFIGISLSVLVYLVVPVLVNSWFAIRTSLFIGIGTCVQGIGGALFTFLGALVIQEFGWRWCYVLFGVVTLAIGVPVSLFVLSKEPADKGLRPIGYDAARADSEGEGVSWGVDEKTAYRSLPFYLIVAACLCLSTGIIFNYYINPYMLSLGMSVALAGFASSLVMVGMCIGKVVVGALCDRSVRIGVVFGCGCGLVALLVLFAASRLGLPSALAACFMFGITYASSSLLGAVLTRYVFGPKDFGRIWPTVGRFIALGNAFGSMLWGFVVGGIGYERGMLLVAGVVLAAMLFSLAAAAVGDWSRMRDATPAASEGETEVAVEEVEPSMGIE